MTTTVVRAESGNVWTTLSEGDKSAIVNGLRVARERHKEHMRTMVEQEAASRAEQEAGEEPAFGLETAKRLVEQFESQAADMARLMAMFEQAERVVLEEDVETIEEREEAARQHVVRLWLRGPDAGDLAPRGASSHDCYVLRGTREDLEDMADGLESGRLTGDMEHNEVERKRAAAAIRRALEE